MSILNRFYKTVSRLTESQQYNNEGSDESYEHDYLENTGDNPKLLDQDTRNVTDKNLKHVRDRHVPDDLLDELDYINEGDASHVLENKDRLNDVFTPERVTRRYPRAAQRMQDLGILWVDRRVFERFAEMNKKSRMEHLVEGAWKKKAQIENLRPEESDMVEEYLVSKFGEENRDRIKEYISFAIEATGPDYWEMFNSREEVAEDFAQWDYMNPDLSI